MQDFLFLQSEIVNGHVTRKIYFSYNWIKNINLFKLLFQIRWGGQEF